MFAATVHANCASICPTRACSDLSPYFVQAIGVFNVVCSKYNLCASSRHLDVTSCSCFLECVHVCVCTLKRLCAFCYAHCCHIKCFSYKTIHEEYFPTKKMTTNLPCMRSLSTELFSHLPFHTDGFVHNNMYYFC